VYEHGVVRPSEPVDLPEGTEVEFRAASPPGERAQPGDGWRTRSIDELAAAQQVAPLSSINQLAPEWPDDDPDDSVDAFLRDLRAWRK
jgi:hypothetical protein